MVFHDARVNFRIDDWIMLVKQSGRVPIFFTRLEDTAYKFVPEAFAGEFVKL